MSASLQADTIKVDHVETKMPLKALSWDLLLTRGSDFTFAMFGECPVDVKATYSQMNQAAEMKFPDVGLQARRIEFGAKNMS